MNRETGFHSSDTLVVVDGSRRKRMMIIAAVVTVLVVVAITLMVMIRGAKEEAATAAAASGKGQIPTVTVVVPGRSQVARLVTARGALAAQTRSAIGIAGEGGLVTRVTVDAGTLGPPLGRCWRPSTARFKPGSAQLAAQIRFRGPCRTG